MTNYTAFEAKNIKGTTVFNMISQDGIEERFTQKALEDELERGLNEKDAAVVRAALDSIDKNEGNVFENSSPAIG